MPDTLLIQRCLEIWLEEWSGTLDMEWENIKKSIFFYEGKIMGCFSQEETDEPRVILIEKKHPAALILESLKKDPSIDPFLPVFLLRKKLFSMEDFYSLLSDQARRMIHKAFETPNPRIAFTTNLPKRPILLNLDTFKLIENYIMERIPTSKIHELLINFETFPILWKGSIHYQLRSRLQESDLEIIKEFSRPFPLDLWLDNIPIERRENSERRVYFLILLDLLNFESPEIEKPNPDEPSPQSTSKRSGIQSILRLLRKQSAIYPPR